MRSRELQQILVNMTGRPIGDVDMRTRVLRALNEVSTGPRGLSAPHMTAVEWAWHLLALVSRRVPDADRVVNKLTDCCAHRIDAKTADLFEAGTGSLRIVALLAYAIEHGLNWIGNVEIDEEGRFAWVNVHRNGGTERLFFSTDESIDGEAADACLIGNRFVIGGAALLQLHKLFAEDADSRPGQLRKAG
jgi:hypothetical protein